METRKKITGWLAYITMMLLALFLFTVIHEVTHFQICKNHGGVARWELSSSGVLAYCSVNDEWTGLAHDLNEVIGYTFGFFFMMILSVLGVKMWLS